MANVRDLADKAAKRKPAERIVFIHTDKKGVQTYHIYTREAFEKVKNENIEVLWNPFKRKEPKQKDSV